MTALCAIRRARGLTQHELARRSGVSLRAISAIEQGRRPRQWTKRCLLRGLGIEWARRYEVFPA